MGAREGPGGEQAIPPSMLSEGMAAESGPRLSPNSASLFGQLRTVTFQKVNMQISQQSCCDSSAAFRHLI